VSAIEGLKVVAALAAALWWALSRYRRPAALAASSLPASLGVKTGSSLDQVIAQHPSIRKERRIAPQAS